MAAEPLFKLLVDAPDGLQYLINVSNGGGYFDLSRVLWDERQDGTFPSDQVANVGGLVRVGGALQVDSAKLTAYQAAVAANQATDSAKQALIIRIRDFDPDTATVAQQKQFLKDIRTVLRVMFR